MTGCLVPDGGTASTIWGSQYHGCSPVCQCSCELSPTKALAKSVKPIASGAQLPCPGLATAAAYTTDTSVNVMIICGKPAGSVPTFQVAKPGQGMTGMCIISCRIQAALATRQIICTYSHLPAEELAVGDGGLVRGCEAAGTAVAVPHPHPRHDHSLQ